MDIFDTAKILIVRIEKLEPESVHKIVGFLLMEELKDDLIRLALSPDKVLEEKVQEAKVCIAAGCPSITSPPPYSSPATIMARNPYWNHQQQVVYSDYASLGYPDSAAEDYNRLLNSNPTGQFLSIEDQLEAAAAAAGGRMAGFSGELYYPDPLVGGRISSRQTTTTTSMPSFSVKTCHYFNKGFCKHGSNCRYIHGGTSNSTHSVPDRMFVPTLIDAAGEDPAFSSGSLEKLEAEITELLKSRRGNPVSIASLPMMYHDKYGRSLQAEGYLTESQRHGRAGYSLTKLLARLKSIRLFERPHGQHFVILAEDAAKYSLDNHNEKKDPGPVVAGSRQIYLTFPAESTFTEEDVSSYFSSFGPVEDVRIPCQPKRMFGFVTFLCPNTVKMVLGKGNPHYVCGARVLVKPYREKSKLVERKYMEKAVQHMYQYYQGNYWDLDHEIHPTVARGCEAPRFLRRHIMELQERALDLETRHLSELKLVPTSVPTTPPYINNAIEELISSEEDTKLSAAEAKRFNHWLYVFNNGPTSSDPSRPAGGSFLHQESSNNQAINLPDSSFAPRTSSSISTVI